MSQIFQNILDPRKNSTIGLITKAQICYDRLDYRARALLRFPWALSLYSPTKPPRFHAYEVHDGGCGKAGP
jgi:hypothetical protein